MWQFLFLKFCLFLVGNYGALVLFRAIPDLAVVSDITIRRLQYLQYGVAQYHILS
jgi:hypothetical protein